MRHLLFGALAMTLASTAPAANDTITPATDAPRLGTYVLLGGDANGNQLYIAFSATNVGARIVLPVWTAGENPALGFSRTVHGIIDATIVDVPFSQTMHGNVDSRIVAVLFSQTVHGSVNATLVHVDFSQTIHGNVVVTSLPAITGAVDATIVHVPFSQTMHGNVVVTSIPAVTGAVDATIVHVPFSQTMHGLVDTRFQGTLDGTPPSRRAIIGGVEWLDGGSVRGGMIVDMSSLLDPTAAGPPLDPNEGAFLVAAVPWHPVNSGQGTATTKRWVFVGATPFTMSSGESSFASFRKIVNAAGQPVPTRGDVDVVAFPPGRRTNSILYSERLNTAANWTNANLNSLTVDASEGPTGLPTAEQLADDTSDDVHGIYTNGAYIDVTPGESLTVSIDAKTNGREWLQINLYDTLGESDAGQWFNIKEGIKGNAVAINTSSIFVESSRIFPANNGYFRCVVTFAVESTYTDVGDENVLFAMGLKANNDAFQTGWYATYAGDDASGMFLTNAQLEYDRHSVGPRIKTLASAVSSGSPFLGTVGVEPGTTVIQASQVALNLGPQPTTMGKKQDTPQNVDAWGLGMMVVRRDIATGPDANNDWMAMIADAKGRVWTHLDAIDFSVTMHGQVAVQGLLTGEGLVLWTVTTDGVGRIVAPTVPTGMRVSASGYEVPVNSAAPAQLFPNNLAGATHAVIQNIGTGLIYLGDANVSAAAPLGTNGIRVSANGGSITFDAISENFDMYAIGTKAAAEDVRVLRY
jgi:hypothetical protein